MFTCLDFTGNNVFFSSVYRGELASSTSDEEKWTVCELVLLRRLPALSGASALRKGSLEMLFLLSRDMLHTEYPRVSLHQRHPTTPWLALELAPIEIVLEIQTL